MPLLKNKSPALGIQGRIKREQRLLVKREFLLTVFILSMWELK